MQHADRVSIVPLNFNWRFDCKKKISDQDASFQAIQSRNDQIDIHTHDGKTAHGMEYR